MKRRFFFLMMLILSGNAAANIVINGTRLIYHEENDSITVQLNNNSQTSSLAQSWTDDGDINATPENSRSPFYVYPPIVKIDGMQGQQLKIKKNNEKLPDDRESVFYLSVLDIPATPANAKGKSVLQVALRSRIKLFYRPAGLTANPETVIDNIQWRLNGGHLSVTNNSPYHFTIAAVNANDSNHTWLAAADMIPPFSEKQLTLKNKPAARNASVTYVDDYGVYKSKNITF
ncbi:TPA: molecular chaperone [Morganella morganii]|uniref:Molecular chaperone n=1 Tax=Morganella morganii TaxID=582 RepID=A0AAN5MHD3_MORMO|nr:molecular chaperone [Morganella morganii]